MHQYTPRLLLFSLLSLEWLSSPSSAVETRQHSLPQPVPASHASTKHLGDIWREVLNIIDPILLVDYLNNVAKTDKDLAEVGFFLRSEVFQDVILSVLSSSDVQKLISLYRSLGAPVDEVFSSLAAYFGWHKFVKPGHEHKVGELRQAASSGSSQASGKQSDGRGTAAGVKIVVEQGQSRQREKQVGSLGSPGRRIKRGTRRQNVSKLPRRLLFDYQKTEVGLLIYYRCDNEKKELLSWGDILVSLRS
jgi:hypothetical protein